MEIFHLFYLLSLVFSVFFFLFSLCLHPCVCVLGILVKRIVLQFSFKKIEEKEGADGTHMYVVGIIVFFFFFQIQSKL